MTFHHLARIILCGALLSCVVFADEPNQPQTVPPFRGKIVLFGAQRKPRASGHVEVLVMNPDGSEVTSLLERENVSYIFGRTSPDARRIAFTTRSVDQKKAEIWIYEANGQTRQIDAEGNVQAWSPDSSYLACWREKGDHQWENFRLDVATGKSKPFPTPATDIVEDWSPDGKTIVVIENHPEKVLKKVYSPRQTVLMALDGTDRRRVSDDPLGDYIWSRFSPDGSMIAHEERRLEGDKVILSYVVRKSDGSHPVEVLRHDALDSELHIVKPDPSRPAYWVTHQAPCWSPDGKQLVCCFNSFPARKSEPELRYALVFVTPEGKFERAIDLQTLGISWIMDVDWK